MSPPSSSQVVEKTTSHTGSQATSSSGSGPGSNSGNSETRLYGHSLFSKAYAPQRRLLAKAFFFPLVVNIVIVLICAALVYGAAFRNDNIKNLKVIVADFDQDILGGEVVSAFRNTLSNENHFSLEFSTNETTSELRRTVFDERAWVVVIVKEGATESLRTALAQGNATYNPENAIEVVVETARAVDTVAYHIFPALNAILGTAVTKGSTNASATFLAANANNPAALKTALECTSCLTSGLSFKLNDLHPFFNAAAHGVITIGSLLLVVFTYDVVGNSRHIGLTYGGELSPRSTVIFRVLCAIFAYFFISLVLTLILYAFSVPMTHTRGHSGFALLWMLYWFSMTALGLALETTWAVFGSNTLNYVLTFCKFTLLCLFGTQAYLGPRGCLPVGWLCTVPGTRARIL
jgi:hypothetical protein